ncbi:SAM-dependent methyltransferase [Pleomorphomonas diazotrophica]|uniref:SAM-dependent methyltransferase n=1 Tax=Pleomorphomonas diazotrophica TaxID=1166257 RepID=A0A1I4UTY1_9HYPH|nr:methyltransferase domain-containing protein [Pleomorphomonas diazotrophica]PKR89828.1 SAM-dependent methyltransferase [Pleomorphomonas diazotrophica]SFM92411.1 Methyltransferase domain-containing protein [Pleomorphomonas diazotrophica]
MRHQDGSAGDADYGRIGHSYSAYRQPDPRIAAMIAEALGPARTVLNVGAGAGSYEPLDREVTPVEPSASMRAQRPAHLAPAIDATAEHLPFADDAFDAAMASFTIHQWADLEAGLREVRRVTRGPVVILTCDPNEVEAFWLSDYAPKVLTTEARRYPSFDRVADGLGTPVERIAVPIPFDCRDGFNEAYYGRPERLLEPAARLSCSAWSFITPDEADAAVAHLASDLKSGIWDAKYAPLRHQPTYRGSLYLLVSSGKID